MCRLSLIGGFSLVCDAQPLKLRSRKGQALLAVLALEQGPVSRERLLGLLWPEAEPDAARLNLRQTLAVLRRDGGEGLIDAAGDQLSLGTAIEVDVRAFQAALKAGDDDTAMALVRGGLLQGLALDEAPFDDWLRQQRALHEQQCTRLFERRAEAISADPQALRQLADEWLLLDPLSEPAARYLIRACGQLGDRSGAVRAYERCRQLLCKELGVGPSAATERVYNAVLAERLSPDQGRRCLLVLPVDDLSERPLLCRGLFEDLNTALARFHNLSLIAPATATHLSQQPLARINEQTGAHYVLRCSLRDQPGGLRLSASLMTTLNEQTLWSTQRDHASSDFSGMADALVRELVAALAIEIDAHVLDQARRQTGQLNAYEAWVQGLTCLREGSEDSDRRARAHFEQALAADPHYARAYTGISMSWFNEWSCRAWECWDQTRERALEFATRAVELDPADHVALSILAKIQVYRREFDAARLNVQRSLALNPNDPDTLALLSTVQAQTGDATTGLAQAELAIRCNPRHPLWYLMGVYVSCFLLGRYEQAAKTAMLCADHYTDATAWAAVSLALNGDAGPAAEQRQAFLQAFSQHIAPSTGPDVDAAAAWLRHVNPLERAEDRDHFERGLQASGLCSKPDSEQANGAHQ